MSKTAVAVNLDIMESNAAVIKVIPKRPIQRGTNYIVSFHHGNSVAFDTNLAVPVCVYYSSKNTQQTTSVPSTRKN